MKSPPHWTHLISMSVNDIGQTSRARCEAAHRQERLRAGGRPKGFNTTERSRPLKGVRSQMQQTLKKQMVKRAGRACDQQEDRESEARLERRERMESKEGKRKGRGSKGKEERERGREDEPADGFYVVSEEVETVD